MAVRRIKALQFLFFFGWGSLMPFFGIVLSSLLVQTGDSSVMLRLGFLVFIYSTVGIFAPPIAGIIADRFNLSNRLVTSLSIGVLVSILLLLIPSFTRLSGLPALIVFALAMGLLGLFSRPIIPLLDTASIKVLREMTGTGDGYGTVRLFGSIGWIIAAILNGFIISRLANPVYGLAVFSVAFLFLALTAAGGTKGTLKRVKIPWRSLFQDRGFAHFLVFTMFIGIGVGGTFLFTGLVMEQASVGFLGIGLAFGLSGLPEVPIFRGVKKFLQKRSPKPLLLAGAVAFLLKFGGYWLFSGENASTAGLVIAQMFHGVGYALFLAGSVAFMDQRSHHSIKGTYQGVYHLFFGGASAAGSYLSSAVMETLGGTALMALAGMAVLVGAVYLTVFYPASEQVPNS
jgi:PPP family 3-phenylpropionic acid transporter